MAKLINQEQIKFQPVQQNANSLIHGRKPAAGHKSFANEFVAVRQELAQARTAPNPTLVEQTQVAKPTSQSPTETQAQTVMPGFSQSIAQDVKTQMRKQELEREVSKVQRSEESLEDAHELSNKFNSSEAVSAQVGQVNHKQVTEALREGNLAEQEANYQDSSNERKRQLANWEELAPSIIEDPNNRAVRIDIPGINDLETLIVKMNHGKVGIQLVGSKDAMNQLMASEAELASKLSKHKIALEKFQAFDGDMLRKAQAKSAVAA